MPGAAGGLAFAWGRVDELHQAVTNAECERDRYREQADRANAERLRLAEELAEAQAASRRLEPELRGRLARDLRGELMTSLIAALIVNATPAGPSAFELAAHLLGELADMTDGREPTLGQPVDARRIDEARLRWVASLAAAAVPAPAPALPVLVDEQPGPGGGTGSSRPDRSAFTRRGHPSAGWSRRSRFRTPIEQS